MVIALGGNAILRPGEKGTHIEQLKHIRTISKQLVQLILMGYRLVITHGNGPQVGNLLLQNEKAGCQIPPMPMDVLVAESQGMIGYMIQQTLTSELKQIGKNYPVVSIVTQVLVKRSDPAFFKPTKPVGPFYGEKTAYQLREERGWHVEQDSGRGYRRLVPSPKPVGIVESDAIKKMLDQGLIVIAAGGGGIPVVSESKGELSGVEGVIDKDFAAQCLAAETGTEILVLLTGVDRVAINFGKPGQKFLNHLSYAEGKRLLQEGQFAAGSMGPKMEAALCHVKQGGEMSVIGSLDQACLVAAGSFGTRITLKGDSCINEGRLK